MSETKLTLGKAIDDIIEALGSFDERERKTILATVCLHMQIDLAKAPLALPHSRQEMHETTG